MIGYIIGLGDRHGDNILIHTHTGEVTHVDFDSVFEKAALLSVREKVPFRLTANIVHAFGIFKEKGVFKKSCEIVMRILRENSETIQSFLQTFINDPLIEKHKIGEMKDLLTTIKNKLNGSIKNKNCSESLPIEDIVD